MTEERKDYGYSDGGGPHPDGYDPPLWMLLLFGLVLMIPITGVLWIASLLS